MYQETIAKLNENADRIHRHSFKEAQQTQMPTNKLRIRQGTRKRQIFFMCVNAFFPLKEPLH